MTLAASAIVLAGGSSRRMGCDKTVLVLDGQTLLERTIAAMSALCDQVIVAGAPAPDTPGALSVNDPPGSAGPVAGLFAGLLAARYPRAVLVACDMPFVSAPLLQQLLDALQGSDAVVPLDGDRPQPLHAVYSKECAEAAGELLARGTPSMHDLLSVLRVNYIPEGVCREFDPAGLHSFNVNTPEDYRRASLIVEQGRKIPVGASPALR